MFISGQPPAVQKRPKKGNRVHERPLTEPDNNEVTLSQSAKN